MNWLLGHSPIKSSALKPGAVLETNVKIVPEDNTQLSGLYKSGPMYCSQCEATGFRRITYCKSIFFLVFFLIRGRHDPSVHSDGVFSPSMRYSDGMSSSSMILFTPSMRYSDGMSSSPMILYF